MEVIFASYWYWFIGAVFLGVLEIVVPGIFLMWIATGAAMVGVFLLAFPAAGVAWQIFALCASITGSVYAGLKWQARMRQHAPSTLNQGLSEFIELKAVVSSPFSAGEGRVMVGGSSYPAICEVDGEAPEAGSQVIIKSVNDHGTFVVEPVLLN